MIKAMEKKIVEVERFSDAGWKAETDRDFWLGFEFEKGNEKGFVSFSYIDDGSDFKISAIKISPVVPKPITKLNKLITALFLPLRKVNDVEKINSIEGIHLSNYSKVCFSNVRDSANQLINDLRLQGYRLFSEFDHESYEKYRVPKA